METTTQILKELHQMGHENTKKILMNHGAREPFDGVKVADLKKIHKRHKKNHQLALNLFDTGHSDAMYLAGLMSDPQQMTKEQLNQWAEKAYWYMLSEYAVAWTAAESPFALEIALEWIDHPQENIASAGWATLSNWIGITPNTAIDILLIQQQLERIEKDIHQEQNRVRYTMNGFVIAVGSFIPELTEKALGIGQKIGKVKVIMGGKGCKVPVITDYINKVASMGRLGKKKKQAKC